MLPYDREQAGVSREGLSRVWSLGLSRHLSSRGENNGCISPVRAVFLTSWQLLFQSLNCVPAYGNLRGGRGLPVLSAL